MWAARLCVSEQQYDFGHPFIKCYELIQNEERRECYTYKPLGMVVNLK